MKEENKITVKNLIYSLFFLVFGILLLSSTEGLIGIVSKVIGSLLIIIGIVKVVIYIYMKGKLGNYKTSELTIGLLIIFGGILFILSSNTLDYVIRILIGLWALFAGINRIILAISIKTLDKTGFKMYLFSAIIMIIVGILVISNFLSKLLGVFIIIYAISEIVDYVYYIVKNKNNNTMKNSTVKKEKKNLKRIKNKKVVDAIVEDK